MELIGTKSGLRFESVVSLCQDPDGMFWVVADSGLFARGKNTSWSIMPAGGGAAACVVADGAATVWVGTRGYGLREISPWTAVDDGTGGRFVEQRLLPNALGVSLSSTFRF